jgi:RNA polymerase sigma-70 factor (sigma-E family)
VHERNDDYVGYVMQRLPWLRRLAYLLTQDWHRADDVVQTAIIKLHRHWRRASTAENLDGYARTVVVRAFLDEQRRWASRVRLVSALPDGPAVGEDHADRLAVQAALTAVPPRQRATLVLRFYCDLSVEHAAEVLGCSAGTVKSQTARGLDALRRALTVPVSERNA